MLGPFNQLGRCVCLTAVMVTRQRMWRAKCFITLATETILKAHDGIWAGNKATLSVIRDCLIQKSVNINLFFSNRLFSRLLSFLLLLLFWCLLLGILNRRSFWYAIKEFQYLRFYVFVVVKRFKVHHVDWKKIGNFWRHSRRCKACKLRKHSVKLYSKVNCNSLITLSLRHSYEFGMLQH
jgi:hypothetical protein